MVVMGANIVKRVITAKLFFALTLIAFFIAPLLVSQFSQDKKPPVLGNEKIEKKDLKAWIGRTKERCSEIKEKNALDACFKSILSDAVRKEGTETAIAILTLLRSERLIDAKFDDHQHVHEIGRATAKLKGVNLDAFLLCPSTYNYGCQHGFFEFALSQTNSYKQAAEKICEGIGTNKPPKLYSYCYHGVGHGLMMALAYDLMDSLAICDQLSNQTAIDGCWQGVFMENTNLAVTDEEKVRSISKTDPLYPCNKVSEKYQWQCYINHAGYLMKRTALSIPKAAAICLSAPGKGAAPCIQSIGLMVTNPIWQKSTRGADTVLDPRRNVEIAWSLCQEMPKNVQRDCVIGAVGNIHNFDETNISRSALFCSLVDRALQNDCYAQIGTAVAGQVVNKQEVVTICNTLANNNTRERCLWGAQVYANKLVLSPQEEERLISDDGFVKQFIAQHGAAKVIETLTEVMPKHNLSCHDRAHEVGRFAYEINGSASFRLCSSQCHSGCYHGATEAFFRDKGTANLTENLETVCQGDLNKFFRHQCIHGIGHGLMAWSNYELYEALHACDTLEGSNQQSSCWTGVFMENIVGGLAKETGHFSTYVNNDPHYPCNKVLEKYKGSCYFLQTSRMLQLFQGDFAKIAASCQQALEQYRISCFQSMGRDVGGTSKHDIHLAIQKCQNAPEGIYRTECLGGAVQDTFWDPSGREEALSFCALLPNKLEIKRCYEIITQRAAEVLVKADYKTFCSRIPKASGIACGDQAVVAGVKITQTPQKDSREHGVKALANGTATVIVNDKGYVSKELTIKDRTKVVFKNNSSDAIWPASNIHPTHQIYASFDPKKPVKPGQSWEFVFDKIGTWRYHDHLSPTLTGTIIVVE